MDPRLRLLAATAAFMTLAVSGGAQGPTTYFSEAAFRAAVGGSAIVVEGFEEEPPWDAVRSTVSGGAVAARQVSNRGITWRSNHPGNEITTGSGAARTGGWGIYSLPHGDQSVGATEAIRDGFTGSSATPMIAVGGWFKGTPGAHLAVLLDGGAEVSLGPLGASFRFYGVVASGSPFAGFELRETEGTFEDQKLIFADDLVVAGEFAASPPAMDGAVAGVANTPGVQGSDWHTDLFLHNGSAGEVTVALYLSPAGGGVGPPVTVAVGPGATERLADVVSSLFGAQGSGAVLWRVATGDGSRLVVNASTYNRVDEVRRYGQQLPGIPCADAIPVGGDGRVVGFTADDRTRSNLILQNVCADAAGTLAPTAVSVTVLDGTGGALAARSYPLAAGGYLQHNRFLADYGIASLAAGTLLVTVDAPTGACSAGGVLAMVSEVNGAALPGTNDGRLIRADVQWR